MSVCGLNYGLQITGDCLSTGSGAFTLTITGNSPDYTVQWISPTTDVVYLGAGVTAYTFNSLTAGTYVFEIYDTCVTSSPDLVSLYISSGSCISLSGVQNTMNFLNNGAITAQTSNVYGTPTFYLYDTTNGYIESGTSIDSLFVFQNLSAGTYYVIANDGGGCTGRSQTAIIQSSSTFDFGFYIVSNSGGLLPTGKAFITGLTGNAPYTYLWSNGNTTSSISGVSGGNYTVTVTDKTGTEVSKIAAIPNVPKLSILSTTLTSPSCYLNDGSVLVTVTGGTPPYTYQLSNGFSNVSYNDFFTFTDLSADYYTVTVIDSGFNQVQNSFSLVSPGGFTVVGLITTDTTCGNNQGRLLVNLIGGSPPYTFTLSGSNGVSSTFTSSRPTYTFSNLYEGDYLLGISDLGPCTYSDTITINSIVTLIVTTTPKDATCGNENGNVYIEVSGGIPPYTYRVTGNAPVTKSDTSISFNNLKSGSYSASVADSNSCEQSQNFFIDNSIVNFGLFGQNATYGSDGIIDVYITDGVPPFTLTWSENVNGQTGLTVTNLSAGTYTLTVTDNSGCTQTRSLDVGGFLNISSYQVFNVCDSDIENTGTVVKKGIQQMLKEGFYDLTVTDNDCTLNQASFYVIVDLSGVSSQSLFYTSTSLNDYPFDNDFYYAAEQLLLDYPGVDSVFFNSQSNLVTINTGCNDQLISLIDSPVTISILIEYDITCVSCGGVSLEEYYPLVVTDDTLYGFDPQNKVFIELPNESEFSSALGITRNYNNTKVWVLDGTGTEIYEYDVVSLVPYVTSYNRTLTLTSTVSRDLIWLNTYSVLSSDDSSQYLASIDITTDISPGTVSQGIFLSAVPNIIVNNSILINSINKTIVISVDITGLQYLRQYQKNGALDVEILLPPSIGYTMYEYNGIFYIIDIGTYDVLSIQPSSPYTITYEYTIAPPKTTTNFIMSQINTYVTTEFI